MSRPYGFTLRMLAGLTDASAPLMRRAIGRRVQTGKEIAERVTERFGVSGCARPVPCKRLLWLHGASLGEVNSLKPIWEWFLALDPLNHVLVTSGSRSSAETLAHSLPARATHQLLPAENGGWINAFLDHWRPDALVMAEQEFWPRLLTVLATRDLPRLVVNARLSQTSFERWMQLRKFGLNVPALAGQFQVQDSTQAERFRALGLTDVDVTGNLKFARASVVDETETETSAPQSVLFAMSHAVEELGALAAIAELTQLAEHGTQQESRIQFMIGPRHIERIDALTNACRQAGLSYDLWSRGARPGDGRATIILVDQYGVMADVYRHASACILGGSFDRHVGSHSPLEALAAGVPVIAGPYRWSQASIFSCLEPAGVIDAMAGGKGNVDDCDNSRQAVHRALKLLEQPEQLERLRQAFVGVQGQGDQALARAKAWITDKTR